MRRFLPPVVLLLVCGLALPAIPTNHFTITAKTTGAATVDVMIEKSQLVLGVGKKVPEGRDAPQRWFILGTKVKSSVGAGFLAYDLEGKDPVVRLVAKQDEGGTDWTLSKPKGRKRQNTGGSVDEQWGIVQPSAGPFKGWHLDVEEIVKDGAKERRLILSKEPKWNVEAARIYDHK